MRTDIPTRFVWRRTPVSPVWRGMWHAAWVPTISLNRPFIMHRVTVCPPPVRNIWLEQVIIVGGEKASLWSISEWCLDIPELPREVLKFGLKPPRGCPVNGFSCYMSWVHWRSGEEVLKQIDLLLFTITVKAARSPWVEGHQRCFPGRPSLHDKRS